MTRPIRFTLHLAIWALALAAQAVHAREAVPFIAATSWDTPFNQIAQVACHNCYEKRYARTFSEVLESVRTLELDFWDQRDLFLGGGGPTLVCSARCGSAVSVRQ